MVPARTDADGSLADARPVQWLRVLKLLLTVLLLALALLGALTGVPPGPVPTP